jgi:hypothetical protein
MQIQLDSIALYIATFILAFAAAGILACAYVAAIIGTMGAPVVLAYGAGAIVGAYVSHKCAMAAISL